MKCWIKPIYKMTLLAILFSFSVYAQTPNLLNYQGKLTNKDGTPANGTFVMIFSLYSETESGKALWKETQNVTVMNGLFNVLLGSVDSFPDTLFTTNGNRFLGIRVGTDPELQPRFQLTSVAFAIHANSASSLSAADGDPTDAVLVDKDGNVGIGTRNPLSPLHIKNVTMVANPIIVENSIANTDNAMTILDQMPKGTFIIGGQQGSSIYFYWKSEGGDKYEVRIPGTLRPNNLSQSNLFQPEKGQLAEAINDGTNNNSTKKEFENSEFIKMISDLQNSIKELKAENDQLKQRLEKLEQK